METRSKTLFGNGTGERNSVSQAGVFCGWETVRYRQPETPRHAEESFARKCVPKQSLGTRGVRAPFFFCSSIFASSATFFGYPHRSI